MGNALLKQAGQIAAQKKPLLRYSMTLSDQEVKPLSSQTFGESLTESHQKITSNA